MSPVAKYIKNLGKSVVYASAEYTRMNMPATKEFIETNDELFKDAYHAITNVRQTAKKASQLMMDTPAFRQGEAAFKNAISDIKSGKLYNQEREDSAIDASFNLDDDFSLDESNFNSSTEKETLTLGEKSIISATAEAASKQSHSTVSAITASTKYAVNAANANANMMHIQAVQMNSTMQRGFTGLNQGLGNLYKFNTEVVKTMADNSKIYFEETTKIQKESNAILKEMLDMQRNMYANANPDKDNKMSSNKLDFLGMDGGVDIKKYGKTILKNIKSLASEKTMGMTDMVDENMLKMIASNPLAAIPSVLVSTVTGPMIKASLQKFDKTMSGVFTSFLAKMNFNANNNSFGGSLGKEIMGKIFGVRTSLKTHLDTSNFNKTGPIPFDWETKKAIVEVLPGYFSRIESLLSGNAPRVFDYKNGRWTNTKEIKRQFDRKKKIAVDSASFAEKTEMDKILFQMKLDRTASEEQVKAMKEIINKISDKRFEDGGWYDKGASMSEKTSRYGVDKNAIAAYEQLFGHISQGTRARSAGEYMKQMNSYNRDLEREERKDTSIYKQLFNGLDNKNGIAKFNEFNKDAMGKVGVDLLGTKDKHGMSIFDYLRNIDINTSGTTPRKGGRNRYTDYNRRMANGMRTAAAQSDRTVSYATGNTDRENSQSMNNININDMDIRSAAGTVNEVTRKSDLKKNRSWLSDLAHTTAEDKLKEMQESGASADEIANYKANMEKIIKAASEGNRFSSITDALYKLTSRPVGVLTGIIDKADQHVYNLLFEEEDKKDLDSETNKPTKGILGKMKSAMNGFVDSIKGKIAEQDKDRKEELSLFQNLNLIAKEFTGFDIQKMGSETKEAFKKNASNIGRGIVSDVTSTYREATGSKAGQTIYDKAKKFATDKANAAAMGAAAKTGDVANIEGHADGVRNVTKSGLTILSKGERVIPADQNVYNPDMLNSSREANRKNEKAIKGRILNNVKNVDMMADGGVSGAGVGSQFVSSAFDIDKNTKLISNMTQKKIEETLPNLTANSAIGAIIGTATGVGGPLLGAIAGSAISLASNSATFQKTVFGEKIFDETGKDTGKRKGGIIGKDLQETMGKYIPDMKKYGVTGAVLGLVGPFGPLTGVMMGSAIGFAKHNETVQNALFGEDGLIGEDTKKVLQKSFPTATKTAIAGLLAGGMTGIGLLPGAVIGAGLGVVASTDKFKDFLLGKEDTDGKRTGGVAGAIRENFVNPLKSAGKEVKDHFTDWLKDKIISPMASAVKPTAKSAALFAGKMLNIAKSAGKKLLPSTNGVLANSIRYSRLGRMAASAGGFVMDNVGKIKGIPEFAANRVKDFGDVQRASHIKSGNADYMTASERLKFMSDRNKDYDMRGFDEAMVNSDEDTLTKMKEIMGNIDESKSKGLGKNERKILGELEGRVSNTVKHTGVSNDIIKAVQSGNVKDAIRMIERSNKMSSKEKADLIDFINEKGGDLREAATKKVNLEASRKKMFGQMRDMGFKGVNEENYGKYKKLLSKELRGREKDAEGVSDLVTDGNENASLGGAISHSIDGGFATQIPILEDMANTLRAIAEAGGVLSAKQSSKLEATKLKGIQAAGQATHDRMSSMNRKYSDLKSAFKYDDHNGSKPMMSDDNKIKLLDLSEAEYKNLKEIGNSGFKLKDMNAIFEMKKDVRDKWLQMAELGYEITDMKLATTLTAAQFNKLIILAKSGIIIDDVKLALKLSTEECERVARAFMNGMNGTSSALGVMSRAGSLDPNSESFNTQSAKLDEVNARRDINEYDGIDGIRHNGNGTFNKDDHFNLNYNRNMNPLGRTAIRAKNLGKRIGTGGLNASKFVGKGLMNASLNHTKDLYRFGKYEVIDGLHGGVGTDTTDIDNVIKDHKPKSASSSVFDNLKTPQIATMADGGEVKKDNQATVVSKGERIEPATPKEAPAAVLKDNKEKIETSDKDKKSKASAKDDKSTTVNTEYGPQTFTRASDGSMSIPNTKQNTMIQKKLVDRDSTQKQLLVSIKELVATNKESLKASLGAAGKKGKKGIFDTLKSLLGLLNPLNLMKNFGKLFTSLLGPLAPVLARLGAPLVGAAAKLGSKALGWAGGKVKDVAGAAFDKFSKTKLGGKLINSKVGKFASKIGDKLGLGGVTASAALDDSQPDDAAAAINVRGTNIESLLTQILNTITGTKTAYAASPADALGGGTTKVGPDGKPVKTGKWAGRLAKAGKLVGLGLLAKEGYDAFTGGDQTDTPSANPTSLTDKALNVGEKGLEAYSAYSTAKDLMGGGVAESGKALEEKATPILEKVKSGFRSVESGIGRLVGGAGKKFGMFKDFIMKKITSPECLKKIVERASKHAAGYAASATGVGVVVTIGMEAGFAASAFYDGYNRADQMLKVPAENVTTGMKMLCGVVAATLQAIPVIGWVLDPEDVIQFAIKTIGTDFGVTDSILNQVRKIGEKARDIAGTTMQKLGEAKEKAKIMGSSAWSTLKGYGSQLAEGAKKVAGSAWDKLKGYGSALANGASKAWNWAKDKAGSAVQSAKNIAAKAYDVVSSAASSAYNGAASAASYVGDKVSGAWNSLTGGNKSGTGKWGRGSKASDAYESFHSQVNPINSMSYNASGDTETQSMADSGCGPASAANMASALGVPMDTKDAARYALNRGYKEKDGGTKPGFFKDYLGKAGIDTKDISGKDDIKGQLQSGHPVLLMGTDKSNTPTKEAMGKSSTPFGTNPHYVVATGLDKNGITIQDPESDTPNQKYDATKVLNNSSLAMAAGKGRWGMGSKKKKSKFGKGPTLDENPPFSTVAGDIAGKVGSSHPELFWAQMMFETGGPDKCKEDIQKIGFDDFNYGGFTWYDGMGEDHKGAPRPANEGGYYAKFSSDDEYADAAYNKVYKSYADELKNCANADDFAKVLKNHGYYASDEADYAAGLNSILNGQYKNSLGNIKVGPGGPNTGNNKTSAPKFGGIFGDLSEIASTLSGAFSIKKSSAAPNTTKPKAAITNTMNYTASQLVSISVDDLAKKLKDKSLDVSQFIQMASYNPNTSRDQIQQALTDAGMWDADTQAAFSKFFKAWDDGSSNNDFNKIFDQYRAGQLNAKEFIEQADKTPAPREVILNALETANNYDGEKMWEDSDLKAYEDYYSQKDGSAKGKWGRSKWGRGSKNPIIQAFNEFKAGRGGRVNWLKSKNGKGRWGKGSVGEEIYQGLQSRGLTEIGAAGVMGNMMQESGLDPNATNSAGYHGLVQWDPSSRWPAAQQWITAEGKDPNSVDGQLDYVAQEAPSQGDAINAANAASDPAGAATAWEKAFERSGGDNMDKRIAYAQQAYESKGANLGGASTGNNKAKTTGKKSIFSKYKAVADAMAKKMQSAIAPMATAVTAGADKIFGKDAISEMFGDENPFSSIFSSGEDNSNSSNTPASSSANGSSQSSNEGIRKASDYATSRENTQGYGNNGCTQWCQVYLQQAGNPFASEMNLNCVTLMEQAKQKGIWKDASEPGCEGDIALLETNSDKSDGPDHAVIYDGKGGCWGNSSSKNLIIHYPNMLSSFPEGLYGYVATGDGGTGTVASASGEARSAADAQSDATLDGSGKWGRSKWGRGVRKLWGKGNPTTDAINKAKTPSDILNAIGDLPTASISKKNRINQTDSVQDAKAKALGAAKDVSKKSKNGKGKWGQAARSILSKLKSPFNRAPYEAIDKAGSSIKSVADAKKYISDIPSDFIDDENRINDSDDIIVARAKAVKNRQLYDAYKANHKQQPIAKDTKSASANPAKVIASAAKLSTPIDKEGSSIKTIADAKNYIADIPSDFIKDYNRIDDSDDIIVARAKAVRNRKLYDEYKAGQKQQSTTPSPAEPAKVIASVAKPSAPVAKPVPKVSAPVVTKPSVVKRSVITSPYEAIDKAGASIQTIDDARKYISDVPPEFIKDYNKINDDDDIIVARAKAVKTRKLYDDYKASQKQEAAANPAATIASVAKPAPAKAVTAATTKTNSALDTTKVKSPYEAIDSDGSSIKTIDDARKYIADVPPEFIKDYNKINDDDDIIVARAKAVKTRKSYDATLKQNGSAPIESKTAAQTIDPNKPKATDTTTKNAKATAEKLKITPDMIGPNGRVYSKNDIAYLTKQGYSEATARDILSKDKRYAEPEKKASEKLTKEDYGDFKKNDVDYLVNRGYTLADAKAFLAKSADDKKKDDATKTDKSKLTEEDYKGYKKNDIDYLLDKGYTLKDAKAFLDKDKYAAKKKKDADAKAPTGTKAKAGSTNKEKVDPSTLTEDDYKGYKKNDIDYLLSKGYTLKDAKAFIDKEAASKKDSKTATTPSATDYGKFQKNDVDYLISKGYTLDDAKAYLAKDKKYGGTGTAAATTSASGATAGEYTEKFDTMISLLSNIANSLCAIAGTTPPDGSASKTTVAGQTGSKQKETDVKATLSAKAANNLKQERMTAGFNAIAAAMNVLAKK